MLRHLAQQQADRRRRERVKYIMRARYAEFCRKTSALRQFDRRQTVIYYIKCTVSMQVCS